MQLPLLHTPLPHHTTRFISAYNTAFAAAALLLLLHVLASHAVVMQHAFASHALVMQHVRASHAYAAARFLS